EAEMNLHSAYLLPLHNIKPERDKVREQIKNIEAQIDQKGSIAQGPGYYAIGRGYLALKDYAKARQYLEKVWQSGYRPPDVAYSLWQVMSGLYEQELAETVKIDNEQLRKDKIKEIDQAYLLPALEYLKISGNFQKEALGYKDAMIAFYKENYEE